MENTIDGVVNEGFEAVVAPGVEAPVADGKADRRKGIRKSNDPAAPYGYKADGVTPRSKPGRRAKAAGAVA